MVTNTCFMVRQVELNCTFNITMNLTVNYCLKCPGNKEDQRLSGLDSGLD